MMERGLDATERRTLGAVCDTFVPALDNSSTEGIVRRDRERHLVNGWKYTDNRREKVVSWCNRTASDVGVVNAVEALAVTHLSAPEFTEFRLLLKVLSWAAGTYILSGCEVSFKPFARLSFAERQRVMINLRNSRFEFKRKAFASLKNLTLFKFLSTSVGPNFNPSWEVLGYSPPKPVLEVRRERQAEGYDSGFRFSFVNDEANVFSDSNSFVMNYDVVIVGSGCGGAVMAAELSRSSRVLLLEKSGHLTYDDIPGTEDHSFNSMYERGGSLRTEDSAIAVLAGSTFGGGSAVNWACCLSTPAYVREEWDCMGLQRFGPCSTEFDGALDFVKTRIGVQEGNTVQHNRTNSLFVQGCKTCGYDVETTGQNMKSCEAAAPGGRRDQYR